LRTVLFIHNAILPQRLRNETTQKSRRSPAFYPDCSKINEQKGPQQQFSA
jgi:hypothetical protein